LQMVCVTGERELLTTSGTLDHVCKQHRDEENTEEVVG